MFWSVRNGIGAAGLPVGEWATAANALLRADPAVRAADVVATYDADEVELDGGLTVDVVIVAADAGTAAETVERLVVQALFDVVGDEEVGWSAHDWVAIPLPV